MIEGLGHRPAGDLGERHPVALLAGDARSLGNVPGDRLALPVVVGGEVDRLRPLGSLGDRVDHLVLVLVDHVLEGEPVVDRHAQRALGQIPDVANRGQDLVVLAEVLLDGFGLGGRFHHHELLCHSVLHC